MAGTPQDRAIGGKLTYEDFVALPDDGKRYEILDGELVVTPSPLTRHQLVSANLGFLLYDHVKRRRLGHVLFAPMDVILDRHTIVEPDILFVSSARSGIIQRHAMVGAPDLLVEILSPSTERRDRGKKAELYARFGVPNYWIVDPEELSLVTFSLGEATYMASAKHIAPAVVQLEPFPELAVALGELAD